jgi:hypothetical protein
VYRKKDARLIGISNCRDKYRPQSMILLKEQHSNIYACVPLSDVPRDYLGVYNSKEHDSKDVVNNGLILPNAKLPVFPCTALENLAKIVTFKQTNLPHFAQE